MKQILNCPLCYEKIYSEIGKGYKIYGMPLEDKSREFCSKICRSKYRKINKLRKLNKLNKY